MFTMVVRLQFFLIQQAGNSSIGGFFGAPDFSILNPFRPQMRHLTGWALAIAIIGAVGMIVLGGTSLAWAGKNVGKQQGALFTITNAAKGLGVLLIGLPVTLILIPIAIGLFHH